MKSWKSIFFILLKMTDGITPNSFAKISFRGLHAEPYQRLSRAVGWGHRLESRRVRILSQTPIFLKEARIVTIVMTGYSFNKSAISRSLGMPECNKKGSRNGVELATSPALLSVDSLP